MAFTWVLCGTEMLRRLSKSLLFGLAVCTILLGILFLTLVTENLEGGGINAMQKCYLSVLTFNENGLRGTRKCPA